MKKLIKISYAESTGRILLHIKKNGLVFLKAVKPN
jgi:hypothetical protein